MDQVGRTLSDDLRGSAPVLTAKDVLLEVREDVRAMKSTVDVLASQHLDERVRALEAWRWKAVGFGAAVGAIVGAFGERLADAFGKVAG